jgi:hypothetical protein
VLHQQIALSRISDGKHSDADQTTVSGYPIGNDKPIVFTHNGMHGRTLVGGPVLVKLSKNGPARTFPPLYPYAPRSSDSRPLVMG